MSEHPIYFERMSNGETWPVCGCGSAQLMSDGRSANEWITAHLARNGEPSVISDEANTNPYRRQA